jgi:NAD+ kinase
MTSTSGSSTHSPVETAAVVAHGRVDVDEAVERVRAVAERAGVQILEEPSQVQLTVAVGGDGTILRTLAKLLGTGVPVIGVNFGRVGFLASIAPDRLEDDLRRVFGGEYRTIEQPTLEAALDGVAGSAAGKASGARPEGGETFVAVNDVVATSSKLGRMIELGWTIAGEDLGVVSCDGMICSTPSGSTAYNLSNGGPVLVRGLDAMAITFIAPHSLDARPLVVPRGAELTVRNATQDVGAAVLVDGHESGALEPDRTLSIRLGTERSLLATLPETTFFGRYRETFTS